MSNPFLRLSGVHRHYGEGATRVRVLDQADLVVESGELVALVAPSGAGKSTLLHLCGLLESPQEGEVEIVGNKTSKLSDRGRTQLRRNTVGYVYQFHHLLPEFTALENVTMPQLIAGKSPAEASVRAMELLDMLGVAPRAAHRPAELSGGEQQRVAIAALQGLIRTEGAAALIATHNHELAKRADRIVTIKDGKVVPHTL
jgi:lipoprotein-releasing system ATP-binding protein